MIKHIQAPKIIEAAGNKPKRIEEYVGRVNSGAGNLSVARMVSPAGWAEPGQTPEFEEISVVLQGALVLSSEGGDLVVRAGQAAVAPKGEWVQYSTPFPEGAEYISVCLPAFSTETAHRDPE